jgi:hypothetical protein
VSGSKSAEEVLAGYVAAMGQELGELFCATSNELSWIHWRWNQHRILFGEKPSRVDLLNEAASFFFLVVHHVFFEDTLLGIARLVGPLKSAGWPNLTVKRFPPLLHDLSFQNEVFNLIEKAETHAAFAIDWRHRHLAHRDLGLALRHPNVQPLAPVTREQVEGALSALRDVLDCIEGKYCNAHTAYSACLVPGDAKGLLYIIQSGLLREREKQARWARGEVQDESELEEI